MAPSPLPLHFPLSTSVLPPPLTRSTTPCSSPRSPLVARHRHERPRRCLTSSLTCFSKPYRPLSRGVSSRLCSSLSPRTHLVVRHAPPVVVAPTTRIPYSSRPPAPTAALAAPWVARACPEPCGCLPLRLRRPAPACPQPRSTAVAPASTLPDAAAPAHAPPLCWLRSAVRRPPVSTPARSSPPAPFASASPRLPFPAHRATSPPPARCSPVLDFQQWLHAVVFVGGPCVSNDRGSTQATAPVPRPLPVDLDHRRGESDDPPSASVPIASGARARDQPRCGWPYATAKWALPLL